MAPQDVEPGSDEWRELQRLVLGQLRELESQEAAIYAASAASFQEWVMPILRDFAAAAGYVIGNIAGFIAEAYSQAKRGFATGLRAGYRRGRGGT